MFLNQRERTRPQFLKHDLKYEVLAWIWLSLLICINDLIIKFSISLTRTEFQLNRCNYPQTFATRMIFNDILPEVSSYFLVEG
jgi:hypothetical protein